MTTNNTWRKPSWLITSITVLGVFFLSCLGAWQLQRAEEKKQIILDIKRQNNSNPEKLELPIDDVTALRFKKVELQGHYIPSRQFVLDNQVLDYQVGYNILTPFMLYGSKLVVLVDRGWVALGPSRKSLPNIDIDGELRTVVATVYVPFGEPYTLGEIDNGETDWPRLIQYLDFAALETRLEHKLLPLTLRLEAGQDSGFITKWPTATLTPKRHLAYAVQWFALAITLLVIFIVLHMPRQSKESSK